MTLEDLEQKNPIVLYEKGYWHCDGRTRKVFYGRGYCGPEEASGSGK